MFFYCGAIDYSEFLFAREERMRNAEKFAFRLAINALDTCDPIVEIRAHFRSRRVTRSGGTCHRKTPGRLTLLHMTDVFRWRSRGTVASRTDRCILAVDIVSCLKQLGREY